MIRTRHRSLFRACYFVPELGPYRTPKVIATRYLGTSSAPARATFLHRIYHRHAVDLRLEHIRDDRFIALQRCPYPKHR
jgi:hypothetical protein